jgi:hypothetical protein
MPEIDAYAAAIIKTGKQDTCKPLMALIREKADVAVPIVIPKPPIFSGVYI